MKLTNARIQAMTYEKEGNAPDLRFDSELPGFGVRVYPTDRKSFFITYRNENSTKKRYTLGNYPTLNVKDARDLAKDKFANVRRGIDPQDTRNAKRAEPTFAEYAAQYIESIKGHNKSWHDDAQRMRDHILPILGKKKLSDI